MKALSIVNEEITRESLLSMAEEVPGAWIGIRIAGCLLVLSGWKSPQVADLFDLSSWATTKWIRKVNQEGIAGVKDSPRPGRPPRLDEQVQQELDKALSVSPQEFGIPRVRWDGKVVAEYLKRFHGINLKVRQAQRWIRKLGYTLRQPVYRFAQATEKGVAKFRRELKKTPGGFGKSWKTSSAVRG